MIRLILFAVVLLALIAAIVVLATGGLPERPRRRLSKPAARRMTALSVLAVGVAIALGVTAGDAWPLLPLGLWLTAYVVLRERAYRVERERIRRAEEAHRQRIDDFGADGAALMDRAEAAVSRVMSSNAAQEGWLGELDFTADLAMVADALRRVTALRRAAADFAAVPPASAEDAATLRDAQRTAARLQTSVRQRVEVLRDCAMRAQQVDQTLRRERERAVIAEQRDDARSRLNAMLDRVELTPDGGPSEAADAVQARVAAFHEVREIVEQQRRDLTA